MIQFLSSAVICFELTPMERRSRHLALYNVNISTRITMVLGILNGTRTLSRITFCSSQQLKLSLISVLVCEWRAHNSRIERKIETRRSSPASWRVELLRAVAKRINHSESLRGGNQRRVIHADGSGTLAGRVTHLPRNYWRSTKSTWTDIPG